MSECINKIMYIIFINTFFYLNEFNTIIMRYIPILLSHLLLILNANTNAEMPFVKVYR